MLTPKKLRMVADFLGPDTHGPADREFTCVAFDAVFKRKGLHSQTPEREAYTRLLCQHGLDWSEAMLGMGTSEYEATAMPVRFMFLEFLALDMETR